LYYAASPGGGDDLLEGPDSICGELLKAKSAAPILCAKKEEIGAIEVFSVSDRAVLTSVPMADAPSGKVGHTAYTFGIVCGAFIAGYLFSLWFLQVYYLGDQEHYTRFYNSLYGIDPQYWKLLQRRHLGSSEPLYRYVIGVAAYFGIDRIHYLSAWNGVLTGSLAYILLKYRASIPFSSLFFTNYYLFVLLGSAERLKFAYIFLAISVCLRILWKKYAVSVLSIFFHTQALIQFVSALCYYIIVHRNKVFSTPTRAVLVPAGLVISLGVAGILFFGSVGEVVALKSAGYMARSGGLAEIVQWSLLIATGVYVFRDKLAFAMGMIPLGFFTFLYGNRVNVATFAFFATMALIYRRTNNPLVLMVMMYMSFKSIQFIADVIRYGTGYP